MNLDLQISWKRMPQAGTPSHNQMPSYWLLEMWGFAMHKAQE